MAKTATALVVDDSRVALIGLSRLLKEQGLQVDTAESGPEAIDYLRHNPPPTAIFLDHMMPGMDGFETLKALKASPATSAIPVVMYTSKEDEGYAQEAQARGAFGVLRKPPQSLEIEQLLVALRAAREARSEHVAADTTTTRRPILVVAPTAQDSPAPPQPVTTAAEGEAVAPSNSSSPWLALAALFALAALGWWVFSEYQAFEQKSAQLVAENAALKTERTQLLADVNRLKTEQAEKAAAESANATRMSPEAYRRLLDTISWALSEQGRYDFGEVPFSDARMHQIRALVTRLSEANFRGVLRLDSHLGEFCLVRDVRGQLRLPPPGTLFGGCERVSYPVGEAVRLAQRQSDAFARFLIEHASTRSPIEIIIFSHGASRPVHRYPDSTPHSAAEWNFIARRNQRVDITLIPAAQ